MNKETNAFTLIELLAVIVILAIIALIATPIVINIIDDSKKNSFIQTANGIIDAGEYYYANQILDGTKLKETKIFEFPNEIEELEFNGEVPKSGAMLITAEGEIALSVGNGKYCVKKMYDEDLKITESSECTLSILSVLATITEEVTEVNECAKKGKICTNGTNGTESTIFAIKVNENEVYNFYVIDDNGKEITLVMDRNLGDRILWINQKDYKDANLDQTSCSYEACNDEGPITVLNALKQRTNNWTNIQERKYIISDDSIYNKYQDIPMIMRATIMTQTEIKNLITLNNNVIPDYLYKNLNNSDPWGYWLSTASDNSIGAITIDYNGTFRYNHGWSMSYKIGLRPVITVSK